jgi:hypothetical protein
VVNVGQAPAPRVRRPPNRLGWAAGLACVAVLAAAGYLAWAAIVGGQPASVPSCSWPLQVRGHAASNQAGLIRCYLRALAHHDVSGLLTLADTTAGPVRITPADFRHAADARTGTASATFTQLENDNIFAVKIMFADHVTQTVGMAPEATTGSSAPWRLEIGTLKQRTGGPPPTKP